MLPVADTLADDLASGRTSSLELTSLVLARATEPTGEGARVFTHLDRERALALAQASDLLRANGIVRSPIEGLPVSIKDLFDYAGQVTTAGSVLLQTNAPAAASAVVVDRLLAAGAVIVGRTNMTEFAYSGLGINPHYGTPLNPWQRQEWRIPGGSSSGAAVSVSDGMAVAGIGSDTGGSTRIPAALCGLVGFKPTARRVSTQGVLPLSEQLDSIGPIARDVAGCALFDAILAGEPGFTPQDLPLAGLRLAVPRTVVFDDVDAQVGAAFERALTRLSAAGVHLHEIEIPAFADLARINAKGGMIAAEAWAYHQAYIESTPERYDPRVVSRILRGRDITAADFIELLAARRHWVHEVTRQLEAYDAMIMPTVPLVAPRLEELVADEAAYFRCNGLMLRNTTFINFLDGAALSIPCQGAGEAPVGMMLAGPAMSDPKILSIGLKIEAALRPLQG